MSARLHAGSQEVLYFGKLPSRGDFVRSGHQAALIQSLDQWQTHTMERLSLDPRWKLLYDAAPASQFALLGLQNRVALAGHWLASQDASGRRFPFITAAAIHVSDPPEFIRHSPLVLARLWSRLEQVGRVAHAATDLSVAQTSLHTPLGGELRTSIARMELLDFLDTHTVASLEQMLAAGGVRLSMRQTMLALGILLRPVVSQGPARLSKGLRLPLVTEPGLRACVASFWMSLVMGFFWQLDAEICVLMNQLDGQHQLLIGFQGASAGTLCAAVDPGALLRDTVDVSDSAWVESCLSDDHGLRKLSNYMRDPGLSLAQALRTYEEVFLGV